jgi:hypothetical protein
LTGQFNYVRLLPKVRLDMINNIASQGYYYYYFYAGVNGAWEARHVDYR